MRVAMCVLPFAWGCASVAHVTTLAEPPCHEAFATAISRVLAAQGEAAPTADRLAESTTRAVQSHALGPRPFVVASPSGADYWFFVQRKEASCVLRLYGRQKGFVSYTNDVTYIATEQLAPCQCVE